LQSRLPDFAPWIQAVAERRKNYCWNKLNVDICYLVNEKKWPVTNEESKLNRTLGNFHIGVQTRSSCPNLSHLCGRHRETMAILNPPLKFFQFARRERRVVIIFPISGTAKLMANQIAKVTAKTRASGIHTQEMTASGTKLY